jgi:polar amino acid transport system substrate-binding protein
MNSKIMLLKPFKTYCLAILLICFSAIGVAFSQDAKPTEKVLIAGLSADYPPFELIKDGAIVGFDVDLANKIAKKLGYKVQIKDMKFASLVSALQTGRIDFAISSMNATEERRKNVDFSIEYYTPKYAMIHKKDKPIASVNDLNGKIIGVQNGTTMETFLQDQLKSGKSFKLISLDKNTLMIEEVKVGRMDGVLAEVAQAKAFMKRNQGIISYSDIGLGGQGYAVAFKKGSLLTKEFNKAIKSLDESGELKKLELKWVK